MSRTNDTAIWSEVDKRRRKLRLREEPCPVEYRERPDLYRSINLVDSELLDAMRGLMRGERRWPLVLFGPTGTGKTLAALALGDYMLESRYWTLSEFAGKVAAGKGAELDAEVIEADLVILDQMADREGMKDLHLGAIERVQESRIEMGNLPAIYISNTQEKNFDELVNARVLSRLRAGSWWQTTGKDLRVNPKRRINYK